MKKSSDQLTELNTLMDHFNQTAQTILESTTKDDKFAEFVKARKSGAEKIQHTAEAKGGPAKLTAEHFKAKAKPYEQALKISSKSDKSKTFAKNATDCLSKLRSWKTMTQKEFQVVMGQLEVWGELFINSR